MAKMEKIKFSSDIEISKLDVKEVTGNKNVAGLKGFYWSGINTTNKTITLSTVNGNYGTAQDFSIANYWVVGDVISIHSEQKWTNCSKITKISGKTITVDSLPFASPTVESGHITDQAVFVLARPTRGLCDFGQYSVAFGESNKAENYATIVAGRQNEAIDQYAAVFGRQNVGDYACLVGGRNNEVRQEFGFASGSDNYITAKQSSALGKANFLIGNAYRSAAMGAYNTIGGDSSALRSAQKVPLPDGEYASNQPGQYGVALGYGNDVRGFVGVAIGDKNIVSSKNSVSIGMNNTIEASQTCALILSTGTTSCTIKGNGDGNLLLGGNSTINTDKTKGGASYNTIIGGDDCHITGGAHQCVVGGKTNTAKGYRTTIFGFKNEDNEKANVTILGACNTVTNNLQTVVGYGANPSETAIFTIGNGTPTYDANNHINGVSSRKNAFEVLNDGTGYLGNNKIATENNYQIKTADNNFTVSNGQLGLGTALTALVTKLTPEKIDEVLSVTNTQFTAEEIEKIKRLLATIEGV